MAIVENRRPVATIVVTDKPTPTAARWPVPKAPKWTTQDTATLLRDYIHKVSGAKLPIARESRAPQGNLIPCRQHKTGAQAWPQDGGTAGGGLPAPEFPRGAGIVGEISPNGIDRGALFGVYDFLERVAGVRWYFPGEIGTKPLIPGPPTHSHSESNFLSLTEIKKGGMPCHLPP